MDRTLTFPDGHTVPVLGQGTWMMGESPQRRATDIAVVRLGVELGMTLIDTAEMYGDGDAETMLGEALAGSLRNEVFLVSKVLPGNAGHKGTIAACERSLKRLKTDRLDLYLLHWRGGYALEETIAGFQDLQRDGKILRWGVSNFDVDDMAELAASGGDACATDQVLYNVARRGPEFDLLPWLDARKMPLMAYSPMDHGRLPGSAVLDGIARRHEATPTQVALAWVLRRPGVIAIPKASSVQHQRENHQALALSQALTAEDLAQIDNLFPPPKRKASLEML